MLATSWNAKGLIRPVWDKLPVESYKREELALLTDIPAPNLSSMNTGKMPMTLQMAERIVAAVRPFIPDLTVADLGAPELPGVITEVSAAVRESGLSPTEIGRHMSKTSLTRPRPLPASQTRWLHKLMRGEIPTPSQSMLDLVAAALDLPAGTFTEPPTLRPAAPRRGLETRMDELQSRLEEVAAMVTGLIASLDAEVESHSQRLEENPWLGGQLERLDERIRALEHPEPPSRRQGNRR